MKTIRATELIEDKKKMEPGLPMKKEFFMQREESLEDFSKSIYYFEDEKS